MNFVTLIGVIGATIILIAFIMNQLQKWSKDNLISNISNIVGSVFLLSYAILLNSIPFVILNGIWALVAIKGVFDNLKPKQSNS
jgi:hypothetical protein